MVVDVSTLKAGLILHDRLFEEVAPREVLVSMECSIGEFSLNSARTEDYPVDACQAKEYRKEKHE
jgi:hypothetical protein